MPKDELISELIELITFQQEEIDRLNRTIKRVRQYIEVYEEYIKGE